MLNETGIARLTPGDMHRNALTRYRLGSREARNTKARTLQDQFDSVGIDLQDKKARNSPTMRGNNDYFFSHFKYAYKGIEIDLSGKVLHDIIDAITSVFPLQEEVDQGCFIGLYEIARLDTRQELTGDWMKQILKAAKSQFNSSATVHAKAKMQWAHVNPGATWSAPSAMANFLREVYMLENNALDIPYHGEGAKMQVATNPVGGLMLKVPTMLKEAIELERTKRTRTTSATETYVQTNLQLVEEYSNPNDEQLQDLMMTLIMHCVDTRVLYYKTLVPIMKLG